MWNSLEVKNIAWIYSCIITNISLMYTALDFYLWRGSIWVFILTIMDKTSSSAPQDNRSSSDGEQSVSVGIIGDKTKLKTAISDDWSGLFEWWLSWPVLCYAQSCKLHAGTYRSRLWQRDKETDKLLRDGSGDAMIGGQCRTWLELLELVLLHRLSPPAAGHPAALWLSKTPTASLLTSTTSQSSSLYA